MKNICKKISNKWYLTFGALVLATLLFQFILAALNWLLSLVLVGPGVLAAVLINGNMYPQEPVSPIEVILLLITGPALVTALIQLVKFLKKKRASRIGKKK